MQINNTIKPVVAIIDYDMGNLFSVQHACHFVGLDPIVTFDKQHILSADAAILPGVGAFGDAMHHLKKLDLIDVIKNFIQMGKPLLGICLGMQLLFTESEEFGQNKGLNIFNGLIHKFPLEVNKNILKIPQIQWNQIFSNKDTIQWDNTILQDIKQKEYMYFVHSFFAKPDNSKYELTKTNYEGFEYCSGIQKDNVVAFQFHPEKSAMEGLKIYHAWAKILNNNNKL